MRDHGRYAYSALPRRPVYDWPNGTRLAVYIAVNVEHFPFGEGLGIDLAPRQAEPDVPNHGWRDWGNRIGVWNLLDALDKHRLPAAALLNTSIYDACPDVAAAFRERGDEIVGHGRTNAERQGDMNEADETALIAEVTARLEREEGLAPLGWMGPWVSETFATPDLLAKAGYRYVMDWSFDDQPQWLATCAGRLLSIPYARPCNDLPMLHGAKLTPEQFADVLLDQFDEMLVLSRKAPLVFNLSLHPFLVGWPFRLRHLRRVFHHLDQHRDEVWLTRPRDIYRHVAALPATILA